MSDPRRAVLVTEGQKVGLSRAAVAAVRALAAAGYRPTVTVSGGPSLAASSRYCVRRVTVPAAESDPRGYAAAVARELSAGRYLTALPASEPALDALDVSVRRLQDKIVWAEAARGTGLQVPRTRVFATGEELVAGSGSLDYPCVVKPNLKRFLARRFDSREQLSRADIGDGPLLVQPFMSDGLRGVIGVMSRGELIAAAHLRYVRVWPFPCGTVASAFTVTPDTRLEARLVDLLGSYEGPFHVDLAGEFLLDVNPRIHAALPAAVASGVNLVAIHCDGMRGLRPPRARGRAGVFFRWIEGDVRSILAAVRHGTIGRAEAIRQVLPRPRTAYSYESLRDPGPLVARARAALSS
ncbi:MAG: hypothetical protein ABR525_10380 [Candidatus Limnocylindria bacterium]